MEEVSAAVETCKREVTASFAPPAPFHPDPCGDDNFIAHCVGEPTREEICMNCMWVALQGQVEAGQITQRDANRKLLLYRISLEQTPFSPRLQVFAMASKELLT